MKVYVVETGCYEQRGIMGIYASLEAAMEAHPAPGTPRGPKMHFVPGEHTDPTPDKLRDGGWQPHEYGGWDNGFDWDWHAEITEYEVEGEAAIGEAARLLTG